MKVIPGTPKCHGTKFDIYITFLLPTLVLQISYEGDNRLGQWKNQQE